MNRLNLLVVVFLVMQACVNLDYQRHLECQHTLDYIIKLVKEDRISQFYEEDLKKCTQSKCCLCGLEFKNATFSSIHIALHHNLALNYSQQVSILFDENIPAQERHQFCHQFLNPMNLTAQNKEDVCIIISEGYYRPKMFIIVVKYILYVIVALLGMIYYSDIAKSNQE